MEDLKIAILGGDALSKTSLIKNLAGNAAKVPYKGMNEGIDVGYTTVNNRRVYLFGGSSSERNRFFEEILPAGIDIGIVMVDSKKGVTSGDKSVIRDMKTKMPYMVFLNDDSHGGLDRMGGNILHGSAHNDESLSKLLELLSRIKSGGEYERKRKTAQ